MSIEEENELYSWAMFTDLTRKLPKSLKSNYVEILSFETTGMINTSIYQGLMQLDDSWFFVHAEDGSPIEVFLISFNNSSGEITDFAFNRFVTEPNGRVRVPTIDLQPMNLNESYVNIERFRNWYVMFLKKYIGDFTKMIREEELFGPEWENAISKLGRLRSSKHHTLSAELIKNSDYLNRCSSEEKEELIQLYVDIVTPLK